MKISHQWLQEFVDCQHVPVTELAEMLTMAGLEVEGLEPRCVQIPDTVVVAEIRDVQPHPEADNLFVCQVDAAGDGLLPIVCGAPNTQVGLRAPLALPGTTLPNGMAVKAAKIRGVRSQGMLCAEDELGISADHSGLLVLPNDCPVGKPFRPEMIGIQDDTVLELGLTPNRGDCLSHIGVAREVATLLALPLQSIPLEYPENADDIHQAAAVNIESPDLCYRYTASVLSNITIGQSPLWLRRRLESVGVRAINNVVDVTNYVMMELGQPLHAFDFLTLAGRKIVVRRAYPGETFVTLDGAERQLDEEILMIADGERGVGIAGVMGGLNTEVSDTTTDLLIESAYFSPTSIRKTSKKLGLSTEASYRFERAIDLLSVDVALRRATKLIAALAGGSVMRDIIDEFPHTYQPAIVSLRPRRVHDILGTHQISAQEMQQILTRLGFQDGSADSARTTRDVQVPSYRPDVTREIDLIEEIGRIYGYNNIPSTSPSGEIPERITDVRREVEHNIRDWLVRQGMSEAVNYSFFDRKNLLHLFVDNKPPYDKVITLKNPLTVDQDVLRTTLIPGLLTNIGLNRSNRVENIRLFESGNIFLQSEPAATGLPEERMLVSGVLTGCRMDAGWTHTQEPVNFYDIKGIVENMLQAVGIEGDFRQTDEVPFLHPGEAAAIWAGEEMLGVIGKLHPDVVEAFQLDEERIYLFELFLDSIVAQSSLERRFHALPKFPAVHRDLALIVPTSVPASTIEAIITKAGNPLLESVVLFDRYEGHQIAKGKIGLTYALTYRSLDKTLTDEEVTEKHQSIIEQLETRLGIVLRQ